MAVEALERALRSALAEMGLPEAGPITLERPRNPEHGDWATNVALTLAKPLRRAPRQIADDLAARIDRDAAGVAHIEVAGPGFINFRLRTDLLLDGLRAILAWA
jgi:arginyl-tRNA synthetase